VLDAIGNTPLVELEKVVPPGSARLLVKLEFTNPSGTMKDRAAKAMIEPAERERRLRPGYTVAEYTCGSTGVSLALVCAVRRYGLEVVTSDAFSHEKRVMMEAYGAKVTSLPSPCKEYNEALFRGMIEKARELSERPGHWFCDQLSNPDGTTGYHSLGEEIWRQTGGAVNAFVHVVGSAHSLHGTTEALWRHRRGIRIVAVEPAESAVLSGGPTGAHGIEGIGPGFVPPLWDPKLVNEVRRVPTTEAMAMCRRLAAEEGLFVGTSSGANVVASLKVAHELGPGSTVVTLMVDSGLRYLSSELFHEAPESAALHGRLGSQEGIPSTA